MMTDTEKFKQEFSIALQTFLISRIGGSVNMQDHLAHAVADAAANYAIARLEEMLGTVRAERASDE